MPIVSTGEITIVDVYDGVDGLDGPALQVISSAAGFTYVDGVATPAEQTVALTLLRQGLDAEQANWAASNGVTLDTNLNKLDITEYIFGLPGTGDGDTAYMTLAQFGAAKQVAIGATAGSLAAYANLIRLGDTTAEAGATRNVLVGDWSSASVAYGVGDIVTNSGFRWVCILAHISSVSVTPPAYPTTSNTYWRLYGARGAITTARAISGSTWSDSEAATAIADAGGVSPIAGDTVTLHNSATPYSETRIRSSAGTWTALTVVFGGNVIVDNTLTAAKIRASAVTADKIAANAVIASKIAVADMTNIWRNPDFAGGSTDGLQLGASGSVVLRSTAGVPADAPTEYVFTRPVPTTVTDLLPTTWIAAAPGETFYFEFTAAAEANTNGTLAAQMRYADSTLGTNLGIQIGTLTATSYTTWTRFSGTVTVPATVSGLPVAYIRLYIRSNVNASPVGAWYITRIIARRAANAEMIVDGAITALKISTDAVTADKIQAGAVLASKISVGDFSNLISDASMTDAGAWGSLGTSTWGVSAATDSGFRSTRYLIITGAAGAYAGFVTSKWVPVEPGFSYYVSIQARVAAGTGNATWNMHWADDEAGTNLTETDFTSVSASTVTASTRTVLAPANKRFGRIRFYKSNDSATEVRFGGPVMRRAASGELIVDGAITALKIGADAVTAAKIQAGAVTASKIAVGDFTVQARNWNFEEGDAGWSKESGWAIVSDATNAKSGTWVARNTNIAAGTALRNLQKVAVEPGETFYAEAYIKHAASSTGTGTRVRCIGYNATLATEVQFAVGAYVPAATTAYTKSSVSFTVGAGVAFVDVEVESILTAGSAYADEVRLFRTSNTTLIANGAITTDKIGAGEVKAGNIFAGAVTADKIAAGSITSSKIAVGDFENLCPNPSGDSGVDGWTAGVVTGPNTGIGGLSAAIKSLRTINRDAYIGPWFDVTPGDEFYLSGAFYPAQAGDNPPTADAAVMLRFADDVSGTNSVWITTAYAARTTNSWQTVTGTALVPANKRYAMVAVQIAGTAGATGSWHFRNIQVRRRNAGALIVDGAISTNKLDAGAVTAAKVSAGAITTSKLLVVPASICPDPYFSDEAWWTATQFDTNGWYFESDTTMSVGKHASLWSGHPTNNPGALRKHIWSGSVAVPSIGTWVRLRARMRNNSNQSFYVAARFYNRLNADLADITLTSTAGSGTQDLTAQGQVPANAVSVRFLIYNEANNTFSGSVSASAVILDQAATADLIVDGAIATNKLAANAVTAAKIAAGTITATEIAAATITGEKIAANTISASNIAADTITAAQIAAGAISASEIAAGAITTEKLLVTGRGMALNADPNTQDVTAWIGTGLSIIADATSPVGATVLRCATAGMTFVSERVPLDASRNYEYRIWTRQETGSSTTYLTVAFYDANDGIISGGASGWPSQGTYHYFGLVNGTLPAAWTEYRISFGPNESATIPAGARYIRVGLLSNFSGTGTQLATGIRLMLKADANLIVDGSILASKIAANAVTAAKIDAGAVTTAKLAAGAVTANELSANAVTAGKIAAGAVSAAQISAGAITTDKLLVTGQGTALNDDPACMDLSAWTITGGTVVQGSSAAGSAEGRYFFDLPAGSSTDVQVNSRRFPINSSRTYSATAQLFVDAGNNRNMYVTVRMWDGNGTELTGASTGWGGTYAGYTYGGLPTPGDWARYGGQFGAGTARPIPASAKEAAIMVWFRYSSGSGTARQAAQAIRCQEVASADLIVDGAITANKIAANAIAVGTAAIQNGAIVNAMIGNAAIDSAKIADAAITTAKIGDAQITNAKINDLNASKITAGTISADRIGAGSITATKIDGANLKITAGGVQLGHDVGPSSGHYGLSLSGSNFNDIFLKRNDGVSFFRVNSGGSQSMEFDSAGGALNIRGSINGGAFTGYAWPAVNNYGFHLGPNGLLLGNANNNRYFQVDNTGNVYAPGFSIVNGSASFSGSLSAAIVNTDQIVGNAASSSSVATSTTDTVSVTVSVPASASALFIQYYLGPPTFTAGSSGGKFGGGTADVYGPIVTGLTDNGTPTGVIVVAPSAGNHTITVTRSYYTGTMRLSVLVMKR
jgi:hypothetical protein